MRCNIIDVGKLALCLFFMLLSFQSDLLATTNNWPLLNTNNVQLNSLEDSNGVPGVRAAFVVNASREKIWSILIDYDNFKKYFPDINKIDVRRLDENGASIYFELDKAFMDVEYVLAREYVSEGYRLTWHRESGDMQVIHGSWEIVDMTDSSKKLVIYESYIDFGNALVTWTIKQFAKGKAEEMVIRLRGWMQN